MGKSFAARLWTPETLSEGRAVLEQYYRLKRYYHASEAEVPLSGSTVYYCRAYYRLGRSFAACLWTPEPLSGGRAVLKRHYHLKRYYRASEAEVPLSGSTVCYCRTYYRLRKFVAVRLWILEGLSGSGAVLRAVLPFEAVLP